MARSLPLKNDVQPVILQRTGLHVLLKDVHCSPSSEVDTVDS